MRAVSYVERFFSWFCFPFGAVEVVVTYDDGSKQSFAFPRNETGNDRRESLTQQIEKGWSQGD